MTPNVHPAAAWKPPQLNHLPIDLTHRKGDDFLRFETLTEASHSAKKMIHS